MMSETVAAPLTTWRGPVLQEWVDYNGHMSESCYLLVFGDSSDAFFRYIGIDDDYRIVALASEGDDAWPRCERGRRMSRRLTT